MIHAKATPHEAEFRQTLTANQCDFVPKFSPRKHGPNLNSRAVIKQTASLPYLFPSLLLGEARRIHPSPQFTQYWLPSTVVAAVQSDWGWPGLNRQGFS